MIRYVLAFKAEPSPCGMSCPCNEDNAVAPPSDEDRQWLDDDKTFEITQDAQTGYDGR